MVPLAIVVSAGLFAGAEPDKPKPAADGLKPLQGLIGSWRGTGYPDGTKEEREKGHWTETITWAWQFDKEKGDACLTAAFAKGKHFARGDLRFVPDKAEYRFTLTTADKETVTFAGPLTAGKQKEQILTLDRTDAATKETHRLVLTLLHANRYLYRVETKPAGGGSFTRKYLVGATKEGEPFATVAKGPECVVTGGTATATVMYKGKAYPVCCSGCRDAFLDDPEKYIREAAKKP